MPRALFSCRPRLASPRVPSQALSPTLSPSLAWPFGWLFACLLGSFVSLGCHDGSAAAEGESAKAGREDAGPQASARAGVESVVVFECSGEHVQGGTSVCRTEPGTRVELGAAKTQADAEGLFVVGFDRDAPATETLRLWAPDGATTEYVFQIVPREYKISRINGLPPSQVSEYSAAQLARIKASSARKRAGDLSRWESAAFAGGFSWPVKGRETSAFGAQRILNGEKKRPHYGVDLAAPEGTPIAAPADAMVTLADDALYFEGAMIVLDHGQGFLSKYLHVSRIDVEPGQQVRRGQVIGAVGSKGRSTGPHLCWRLKWRDRNLDPSLWMRAD